MSNRIATKIPADGLEDWRVPEAPSDRTPPLTLAATRGERRRFLRWNVSWPATLFHGERIHDCAVLDFSEGGAQINMARVPPVGTEVLLKFPFTIFLKGRVVWRHDGYLGLSFDDHMRRSAKVVEEFLLERSVAC